MWKHYTYYCTHTPDEVHSTISTRYPLRIIYPYSQHVCANLVILLYTHIYTSCFAFYVQATIHSCNVQSVHTLKAIIPRYVRVPRLRGHRPHVMCLCMYVSLHYTTVTSSIVLGCCWAWQLLVRSVLPSVALIDMWYSNATIVPRQVLDEARVAIYESTQRGHNSRPLASSPPLLRSQSELFREDNPNVRQGRHHF